MGNKLKGWVGMHNGVSRVYRADDEFMKMTLGGEADFADLGMRIIAMHTFCKTSFKDCELNMIGYMDVDMNNLNNSFNYSMYGHGICLRIHNILEVDSDDGFANHTIGCSIEQILGNKKNIIIQDDISRNLTNTFYKENKELLEESCQNGEVNKLKKACYEKKFNDLFNKYAEKERCSCSEKYSCEPLILYGHKHENRRIKHIGGEKNGYELINNGFPECLKVGSKREDFFTFINDIHKLQLNIYGEREKYAYCNSNSSNFSLVSVSKNNDIYQIIDYALKTPDNHHNRLGFLLKLNENENGTSMNNIIRTSLNSLSNNMKRFRKNTWITIIENKVDMEFNPIRVLC